MAITLVAAACGVAPGDQQHEQAVVDEVQPGAAAVAMADPVAEHGQVMHLINNLAISHRAVQDGRWSNPGTWQNSQVPGAGANVLIPEGVTVSYNTAPDAELDTVRIDGTLDFPSWTWAEMNVDTILVNMNGRLKMGTRERPIERGVRIRFNSDGNINHGEDPSLLSRGLVAMGRVEIYGQRKTSFLKVARDPRAGDTTIELAEGPEGWSVGDEIVLTGTRKQGHGVERNRWLDSEDEVRTIQSISGGRITLDRPLDHDHPTPAPDLKAYVANLTRTVQFSSEDGADTLPHQRGHVMLMHHDSEVRYAAFNDLGRTDKSRESQPVSAFNPIRPDSNIQGRYALHLHKTGVSDPDIMDDPIYLVGNVANGSPGWGITQHISHAIFAENVTYDVFGAGFVSESGNDTGVWTRNIAIKSQGIGGLRVPPNMEDIGRYGDGFHFNGRMVRAMDNVAANVSNGYIYYAGYPSIKDEPRPVYPHQLEQPEIRHTHRGVKAVEQNLSSFRDNEVFAADHGLSIERDKSQQRHDLRSLIENFTGWEVRSGVYNRYSPHYTWTDLRLIGTNTPHVGGRGRGMMFDRKSFDQVIVGATVENFEVGGDLWGHAMSDLDERHGVTFIDVSFRNVGTEWKNLRGHRFMTRNDLRPGQLAVEYKRLDPIRPGQTSYIEWAKADSVGITTRFNEFDPIQTDWKDWGIEESLREWGFHRLPNGDNVFLLEDFAADRGTADFMKIITPMPIEMTTEELIRHGAPDNGVVNLGGPAPTVQNEQVQVPVDGRITIDVLANDRDPDGGRVWIDGFKHPEYGIIAPTDDGKVTYIPFPEQSGVDQFSYWVRDEEANLTRGEVSIRIGGGAIPPPTTVTPTDPGTLGRLVDRNWRPWTHQEKDSANGWNRRDVLANDFDADGDPLFLTEFVVLGGRGSFDFRVEERGLVTATEQRYGGGHMNVSYEVSDGNFNFDHGAMYLNDDRPDADAGYPEYGPKTPDGTGVGFGGAVIDAWLIDATTDRSMGAMVDAQRYDRRSLGAQGLSFGVATDNWDRNRGGVGLGSVEFVVNGRRIGLDNSTPFTAFGENGSDINGQRFDEGEYLVEIHGFSGANGGGRLLFEKRARITLGDASGGGPVEATGRFVLGHSGLCIGAEGGPVSRGASVRQVPCAEAPQFDLQALPGGGMQARVGGQCLEVAGGGTGGDADLQFWDCKGDGWDHQILSWAGAALQFRHSELCLDVAGGSEAAGAEIIQWRCHGGPNQSITVDGDGAGGGGGGPTTTTIPTPSTTSTTIGGGPSTDEGRLVLGHSGLCLGAEGGEVRLGANVVQVDCATAPRFELEPVPGGFRARAGGHCLDVVGTRTFDGADIVFWRCLDGAQNETITWRGSSFEFVHSGKCLDVVGASRAVGAEIVQWRCHGGPNQSITVDGDGGGGPTTTRPQTTTTRPSTSTTRPPTTVRPTTTRPTTTRPTTVTTSPPSGDRLVLGHSGLCLGAEGGEVRLGANVVQVDCAMAPRFELEPVPGGFRARAGGHCLDVVGTRTFDGADIVFWRCLDGAQNETITWRGSSFEFVHSGKCLDVVGASRAVGAEIVQWRCHGGPNQSITLRR